MRSPLPAGVQRVTVRLAYQNPHVAIKFLDDAFGFTEIPEKRLEGSSGSIIVAEIRIGDCYIMIGPSGSHSILSPSTLGSSSESIMVYVDDIDLHFERARDNGAEIVAVPTDQYWGDRRYEAKDIEGHLWFFHERTKDIPREEIEAIEASFKESQ